MYFLTKQTFKTITPVKINIIFQIMKTNKISIFSELKKKKKIVAEGIVVKHGVFFLRTPTYYA